MQYYGYTSYGMGTGLILLQHVRCTGTERNLFECSHTVVGLNDYRHYNDVGIMCPIPPTVAYFSKLL